MASSCDSISILGLIVITQESLRGTKTQWHNCLLYLHMCPSPHLPQCNRICHNGDVQASQKHTSNIFNFPSQDGYVFLLQVLTMVASSAASARSWTLTSRLFPGRRSMPRRHGQVLPSFVKWRKTIKLTNHIVHHYFHARWDIVFQGESRGRHKDCFEKGGQVQSCIEMFCKNCIWDVHKRWTVVKISSCESS